MNCKYLVAKMLKTYLKYACLIFTIQGISVF